MPRLTNEQLAEIRKRAASLQENDVQLDVDQAEEHGEEYTFRALFSAMDINALLEHIDALEAELAALQGR